MKTMNRKILTVLIPSVMLACQADANSIVVHNQNDKPITVTIQAEGKMMESLPYVKQHVDANSTAEIRLNRETLGNRDTFFVRGRTGAFSLPTTCEHLSIDQNYDITFNKGWTGPTYKVSRTRT